jgi:hypothetical protein
MINPAGFKRLDRPHGGSVCAGVNRSFADPERSDHPQIACNTILQDIREMRESCEL